MFSGLGDKIFPLKPSFFLSLFNFRKPNIANYLLKGALHTFQVENDKHD